ncbi:MAG TPA: hypothetical protein QF710_02085 [Candidatus Nitrosopelagicus sp.]|nr:hypothetical protein [Candidatus Nitrosopelagicus sp.]
MTRTIILASFLSVMMLTLTIVPAFGAQMEFRMIPEDEIGTVTVKFQRTVFLEYEEGGKLADELRGLKTSKVFSTQSEEIRDRINYFLKNEANSDAVVTDVQLDYDAQLTGRGLNTSIDYKIVLTLTVQGHVIRQMSDNSPGLIDMDWRGFIVDGPVDINVRGVDNEINLPISYVAQASPSLYSAVKGSEAETILNYPLMNAAGIKAQPLGNWHFLFDPTGINADAATYGLSEELAGRVWSSYTMGESSLREGIQIEKVHEATFTADKLYTIRAIESADSANVHIGGFASVDVLGDSEVFGVSKTPPEGFATTATGEFPVMIIYGMAGMAGVVGIGVFIISEKKRKNDEGQGQSGIDPSRLRAASTSTGAGGYKTNRGESYLDDETYEKTRSVYEQSQVEEKQDEQPTSNKGSMPKGWKPE